MTEERREKFVNLAEKRTTNAIKHIRLIGNLSNKGNYSFEDKDVAKIVHTLTSEVKAMKERFSSEGGNSKPEFKL